MAANLHPRDPILLVDDDRIELEAVRLVLESAGYTNVEVCANSKDVPRRLQSKSFSVILLDLVMPDPAGPELLPVIQELQPQASVVFLSSTNDVGTAVDLLRRGAHDYLTKPFESSRLLATLNLLVRQWEVEQENRNLRERMLSGLPVHPEAFEGIVTADPAMTQMFTYIEAIAGTTLPVLITGETGVGKELLAGAVHRASARTGEFVAVNIGGLDDQLFSDALFGHQKGAYTGATTAREGLIAKADGGTLFLDEIGELSPESQVKVLRLLQNREYYPLGSDRIVRTDARLVFATNQDLPVLVEKGSFRKDLYFRLWSHRVAVPPLRNRRGDISLLLTSFLERAAAGLKKPFPALAAGVAERLSGLPFPGNVRELEGLVSDALVRWTSGPLKLEHFGLTDAPSVPVAPSLTGWASLPTLKIMDEALVAEALRRTQGNQGKAAMLLGITRTALNKRLNKI
jgi:DNA-binding NtrC family response regulator